jgi:hypothetical protein
MLVDDLARRNVKRSERGRCAYNRVTDRSSIARSAVSNILAPVPAPG